MATPSPYRIGNIPNSTPTPSASSKRPAAFPATRGLDPLTGTATSYMTWHWPAYPNSFGPYWPDPDQLPGQANYTGLYILPQIGLNPMKMDPNLCQCYHMVMNVALMDGSVRNVSPSLSQQTWTNALNPADGQALGGDWQ